MLTDLVRGVIVLGPQAALFSKACKLLFPMRGRFCCKTWHQPELEILAFKRIDASVVFQLALIGCTINAEWPYAPMTISSFPDALQLDSEGQIVVASSSALLFGVLVHAKICVSVMREVPCNPMDGECHEGGWVAARHHSEKASAFF